MLKKLSFATEKNGVTNLTQQIRGAVEESGAESGACIVYTTHTTAGITILSFWDECNNEDIQDELRRLIPTRVDFKHQFDTPEDAAGHIKSAVVGASVSLIVEQKKLLMGHSQGVYFLEFDGPRSRECYVKVLREWPGNGVEA